jgi:hypothetical protein
LADYLETVKDQPEVVAAAKAHHALPFWGDIGGCLLLRPSGSIVAFGWDTPTVVEPVEDTARDRGLVHAARGAAAKRFPNITGLSPEPGPSARTCPGCKGTGRIPFDIANDNFVCQCGGLGWLPE